MKLIPGLFASGLVLALLGCASAPHGGGAPSGTDGAGTDPLGSLIVTSVPAGFTRQPETSSHTGPMDLAAAVRDDAQTDAQGALRSAGFEHGYDRLWVNAGGAVIGVQVYRFATAAGAQRYRERLARIASAQATTVRHFAVAGVPAAAGGGTEVDVEGNVTEQVSATTGRTMLQLVCSSRDATGLRSRAVTLAGAQYRRLAASF